MNGTAQILSYVLLSVSLLSKADAMVFNEDDRIQVSTVPGSVYSPIGIAYGAKETKYATATLVGRCYAVTSQHIFGKRESPLGKRLSFAGGLSTKFQYGSPGIVIAVGGMEKFQGPGMGYQARARDWLLFRLDNCLGDILGTATLVGEVPDAISASRVSNAGFPTDHKPKGGLTVDPSCRIRTITPLVWLHDCGTYVGNSGGPVYRIVKNGSSSKLEVYAIESGGWPKKGVYPYSLEYGNQATPASRILPYIKDILASQV